jgi:branched-chain amino acid transport system ATP-binding protein
MMLRAEKLETFYGESQVLFGMDLAVDAGEVVTLLGRNGMGKTTTVRSIMGLTRPRAGRVWFEGAEITGLPAYRVARAGLGLVPEGRQIFANLTLRENLVATARPPAGNGAGAPAWTLERVFELFPALAARAKSYGDQLSGGEQQMLAIGRALMTNPRLLILDEATEGLAGGADPHRRPPRDHRKGSRGVDRNLRRTRRRPDTARALSRGVRKEKDHHKGTESQKELPRRHKDTKKISVREVRKKMFLSLRVFVSSW